MSDEWTFITNHGAVLILIASDPNIRIREIAERLGITERATGRIVSELDAGGYVTKTRVGRRNRYGVNYQAPMRRPELRRYAVGELLVLLSRIPAQPSDER